MAGPPASLQGIADEVLGKVCSARDTEYLQIIQFDIGTVTVKS